jgi:hypothetical protein
VSVLEGSAMPASWREVEVNPLGPVQAQVPPEVGCGPRLTEAPEATVAVFSSVQVVPPFTEIYGVIAVGVQVGPVPDPPVPVTAVKEAVPSADELPEATIKPACKEPDREALALPTSV